MNVVLFAWCPSSIAYLSALDAAGALPCLVVTGSKSSAAAPLAVLCDRLGVPLDRCADVNAPAFVARLAAMPVDLLLVAGCAQILGPAILAVPRRGALNFHPSRLPWYRGKEPLFWALYDGASTVGITVHHLTSDVDGGPIVIQREVPVPASATSASLAAIVDGEGAALIPAIVDLARRSAIPPGDPPRGAGSRVPALGPHHGLIDFSRTAEEIDRLIRAAHGEIAAYCFYRGMRLIVLEGSPIATGDPAPPGRIVAVDEEGLIVGARSGLYRIRRFFFLERVYAAHRLAEELGITVGEALTSDPAPG